MSIPPVSERLVVLAIAAHPDDIEFMMAGTLLHLQAHGAEIHLWNLCSGNCGTEVYDTKTIVRMRTDEAKAAAELIGAVIHPPIANDLELLYDVPNLRQVSAVIRQVKPSIVLTQSPVDYMEDHQNACRLAVTGAFSKGMRNFSTVPATPLWSGDTALYHALPHGLCNWTRQPIKAEFYVDVEPFIETKKTMLAQHKSQKEWLDASQGMDAYLQTLEAINRQIGSETPTYTFAEGWRRHSHWGFGPADYDPVTRLLSDSVWIDPDYETMPPI